MNVFDVKTISKRMAEFAWAEQVFAQAPSGHRGSTVGDHFAEFVKAMSRAVSQFRQHGMNDAADTIEHYLEDVRRKDHETKALVIHAKHARMAVVRELKRQTFLHVPNTLAAYLDNDRLLGDQVWEAFPKARTDVKDAGNCLAADCNTAAVFHLMRVSEHGLRRVAQKLRVTLTHKAAPQPIEYADWHKVVAGIRNKITTLRALGSSRRKDRQLTFYSDIADQCEYLKDIWRNPVSHTRTSYNASEAMGVKIRVSDFMNRIARGPV
jgi:hypothetical protein